MSVGTAPVRNRYLSHTPARSCSRCDDKHDGGAAVALGFERGAEPARGVGIEALPRLVEDDEAQRMAAERGAQPQQLPRAARQRADAAPVGHHHLAGAQAAPRRRPARIPAAWPRPRSTPWARRGARRAARGRRCAPRPRPARGSRRACAAAWSFPTRWRRRRRAPGRHADRTRPPAPPDGARGAPTAGAPTGRRRSRRRLQRHLGAAMPRQRAQHRRDGAGQAGADRAGGQLRSRRAPSRPIG